MRDTVRDGGRRAAPTNVRAVNACRYHVIEIGRRALRRRRQVDGAIWDRIEKLADDYLPKPLILRPWLAI
jgi:RNA-directed DNA polymerase